MSRFRASSAPLGVALLGWAASILLIGCAGWRDYGDTYYAHRGPDEPTYAFGQPGGDWRPVRDIDDIQVAWVNTSLDGVGIIEVYAQCNDQGDSSLEQYTDHLRIDWDGWTVISQSKTQLLGRAALRTVVDASLDGIGRRNELWVVKKDGCLFDLRFSAGASDFASGQAAFSTVVKGLRFPY